ncbi:50S ribosomal protein L10 [Candidatus Cerribacteria bacterium 'Amazon FNV 2010 28 9']|uniref:Large ribosomal subunit protein uL10 n=1 Tax=Candidatus Cerribacteria bacterium 'Amazon FNV 2010 28 9' TaxID=2081795 RepID=A0A317JPN6_9BACT|nr:MAG: 50S ribosomal protein L10 [Candidatus Cerribacteria bacterium 'Amazon FNV 2010 28 9']
MPNNKNIAQTAELEEKVQKAKSIVFTKYAGLSVKQQTKLRSELKKAGAELVVAKNTLLARILKKEALSSTLQGQTATLFSYEDEVKALKVLVQFAKDNTLPEVGEGLMGGEVLSKDQVIALSKLPGKEELIAKMMGSMKAPGNNLVGVLTASIRDLVFVLSAVAKKNA